MGVCLALLAVVGMMSPLPWWAKALIAAALLALASWVVHTYNESLREDGRKEIRADRAKEVQEAQLVEDRKAAERRRKDKEIENETAAALTRLAADAAGSRAAADKLQRRVAELLAAARRPAGSGGAAVGPAPGQQGEDPLGVFALMLGRLDGFAERAGDYADRLRIAGQGCERRFDTVTDLQLSPPAGTGLASPGSP